MKKDFGAAHSPPADIKTQAELLARLRQRPTPTPQMHLTPGGSTTATVNREVHNSNEQRIAKLRESLGSAKEGLETDFALKPKEGQARADFGRSR